jgi:excisionase family DNA binding protein
VNFVTTPYLTTAEAARRYGVSVERIHQMVRRGELRAERFGRAYLIRPADLERARARRRPRGRPRQKSEVRGQR